MNKPIAISAWSGGKDSCFAYYKALEQGYQVKYLLNFVSGEEGHSCFHGVGVTLLQLQAKALGVELIQKDVTEDRGKYEQKFKEAVSQLRAKGVERMVFGDIYLLDHINWVERVCRDLKIQPVVPLWEIPPEKIAQDFINCGFKAIVVRCKADLLGKEFIGRYFDKDFLSDLPSGVDPCGENGEFHTLVIDGPIFKKRIEITKNEAVFGKGFWDHWSLDIKEYQLRRKK